jgi:RNA polymerase sigma factor (TIGR02999 family)
MTAASSQASPGAVTVLLGRLGRGDRAALAELTELVYPELRKLARALFRGERRGHLLQPTALVNEAYLRFVGHEHHDWQNRAHFFGAVAQLMRRILVDHARANLARKRGGGATTMTVAAAPLVAAMPTIDMLALDRALDELEKVSPRQARIVELRCLTGLSVQETAEALAMNPRTVDRDWAAARVWLRRRLRP